MKNFFLLLLLGTMTLCTKASPMSHPPSEASHRQKVTEGLLSNIPLISHGEIFPSGIASKKDGTLIVTAKGFSEEGGQIWTSAELSSEFSRNDSPDLKKEHLEGSSYYDEKSGLLYSCSNGEKEKFARVNVLGQKQGGHFYLKKFLNFHHPLIEKCGGVVGTGKFIFAFNSEPMRNNEQEFLYYYQTSGKSDDYGIVPLLQYKQLGWRITSSPKPVITDVVPQVITKGDRIGFFIYFLKNQDKPEDGGYRAQVILQEYSAPLLFDYLILKKLKFIPLSWEEYPSKTINYDDKQFIVFMDKTRSIYVKEYFSSGAVKSARFLGRVCRLCKSDGLAGMVFGKSRSGATTPTFFVVYSKGKTTMSSLYNVQEYTFDPSL